MDRCHLLSENTAQPVRSLDPAEAMWDPASNGIPDSIPAWKTS